MKEKEGRFPGGGGRDGDICVGGAVVEGSAFAEVGECSERHGEDVFSLELKRMMQRRNCGMVSDLKK